MKTQIVYSFLPSKPGRLERKAVKFLVMFHCTFALMQKYQKIKTANKFLKFCFITLKKKNSPGGTGLKQLFLFNPSTLKRKFSFAGQALHYTKFFYGIYLRSLLKKKTNTILLRRDGRTRVMIKLMFMSFKGK